jgi:hypothetical protein
MGARSWIASLFTAGRGLAVFTLVTACTPTPDEGAFVDHEESSDFDPVDSKADGVSATFNRNEVVTQALFEDASALDVATVQAFLERTPYGTRSFLASEKAGGRPFSEVLVEVAATHQINPLMLLARVQVERSLISKTTRPNNHAVDFAFGCGCPDNKGCSNTFRGIDKQLACAAKVMRDKANDSASGTGQWRAGSPRKTLDNITVTPTNHATAAMYAYTPWVLQGQGGNWLVWNITKRFLNHLEAEIGMPNDFVGSPCSGDDEEACTFSANGEPGFCHEFSAAEGFDAGFCSLRCAGFCPDRGTATTFCVELEEGAGACVLQAGATNGHCADIPGTHAAEVERFVGSSGVAVTRAVVCMPHEAEPEPEPEPETSASCMSWCGRAEPAPGSDADPCFCDAQCAQLGDCCSDHADVCA